MQKISRNFLVIVEGAVTEKKILEAVFQRYGYEVERCGQLKSIEPSEVSLKFNFDYELLAKSTNKVFVVQGEKNRLSHWLKDINRTSFDYANAFREFADNFAGVFLLYDVDHNSNEVIETMFAKFNSETDMGLLLLSSPCIEVLGDTVQEEFVGEHLSKYKSDLNKRLESTLGTHVENYIINNFEELAIRYLDQNRNDFDEPNVMEHPQRIIAKINEMNDRSYNGDPDVVCYRYFTTVAYVCIAYILGLAKEIDNYQIVRDFFESKISNKN